MSLLFVLLGGAMAAIGAACLLGWGFHDASLIHLHRKFPAMLPMDAALVVCLGAGWCAVGFDRLGAAKVLAALVMAMSLSNPALPRGWGASPLTNACLLLAGAGLFLVHGWPRFRLRTYCISSVGAVLLTVGLVALGSYATGISPLMERDVWMRFAFQTAIALSLAGSGLLLWAWQEWRNAADRMIPKWPLAMIPVIVATAFLWQLMQLTQEWQVRQSVRVETSRLKGQLVEEVEERFLALFQEAYYWNSWPALEENQWEQNVTHALINAHGYQAVTWMDPASKVLRSAGAPAPFVQDMARKFSTPGGVAGRYAPQFAYRTDQAGSLQGIIGVPLYGRGEFLGSVFGVFQFEALMASVFADQALPVSFTLLIGDSVVYAHGPSPEGREARWVEDLAVPLHGVPLRLRAWPTEDYLSQRDSALPELVLVGGLLIGLILAFALHAAQMAHQRALIVEQVNQQLTAEVSRRKHAQEELQRMQEQLERQVQERTTQLTESNQLLHGMLDERRKAEEALREARDLLEQRVQERTGELLRLNDALRKEISERKRAEGRLIQANAELESREQALKHAMDDLELSHTELEALHLRLIHAEKMDSIGRLAAGVAHEVKNPLTALMMGIEYLRAELPKGGPHRGILKDMDAAAKRADATVRGLMDFAVPQQLQRRPEHINDIIKQSLMLMKHEMIKTRVTPKLVLADDLPKAMLDRNKVIQVFVNLFKNAAQAMPKGGTLTVSTAYERDSAGHSLWARNGATADMPSAIVVHVDDTGGGIPEGQLTQIFHPFFTTKKWGKGTGLGLTVVQEIIRLHGGHISIANRPEGGARASVWFPVQAHNGLAAEAANHHETSATTHSHRG